MIETQQQDIEQQLQEAVLKAAMPAEDDATVSAEAGENNGQKTGIAVGSGAPGPGRPRNVKNRLTNLREAVLKAFDTVGGPEYLVKLANGTQSDRAAFVGLVSKVLPTQVNANVEGGVQIQLSWLGSRSIGTTMAQPADVVTQVVDMQKDSHGKYRIIDQVTDAPAGQAAGGGGSEAGKPAGDAQDA